MKKLYQSEVLIYTEDLPNNVENEVLNYIEHENSKKPFTITEQKINIIEKEKFPDATTKFSIIGDCANWTDEFRNIIKLLRMYTICVLIV